jgi:hypothetical protein
MIYKQLSEAAAAFGERNDCAVKALAVVSGQPYHIAHGQLRLAGRKPGRRTPESYTHEAARQLGLNLEVLHGWDYASPDKIIHRALPQWHVLRRSGKTVATLERALRRHYPGQRFLIRTSGHILAFDGTEVQDWTKGRRHRVIAIIKVSQGGAA